MKKKSIVLSNNATKAATAPNMIKEQLAKLKQEVLAAKQRWQGVKSSVRAAKEALKAVKSVYKNAKKAADKAESVTRKKPVANVAVKQKVKPAANKAKPIKAKAKPVAKVAPVKKATIAKPKASPAKAPKPRKSSSTVTTTEPELVFDKTSDA